MRVRAIMRALHALKLHAQKGYFIFFINAHFMVNASAYVSYARNSNSVRHADRQDV